MNKKKKKKNFCLSYRETLPTRSIDVDLTFIVDEQRSSIKNVLETNNNSSSGSGIRKGTKRTRIYVCGSIGSTRDRSTLYTFVISTFGKNFNRAWFFSILGLRETCICAFSRFFPSHWSAYTPSDIDTGSRKVATHSSYATVIYNKLEIGPNIKMLWYKISTKMLGCYSRFINTWEKFTGMKYLFRFAQYFHMGI